jgi:carbonic anhydrase
VPIEKALPIAVEANIVRQVGNLSETAAIRNAWKEEKDVSIHGWIYELATGRLRPLEVNPRLNEGN